MAHASVPVLRALFHSLRRRAASHQAAARAGCAGSRQRLRLASLDWWYLRWSWRTERCAAPPPHAMRIAMGELEATMLVACWCQQLSMLSGPGV